MCQAINLVPLPTYFTCFYALIINIKMHPSTYILYIVLIIFCCGDLMKIHHIYPSQERQLVSKKRSPRMVQTVEQG